MDPADLVRRARALCPLPASAQRVIELSGSPDASLPQIAHAVALDPVLSVEVLRVVNSAAYGRARRVTDLAESVLVLGLAELHDIALAMSMLAAFHSPHRRMAELQSMAVVRGALMRCTSRVVGIDARASYPIGALADLGTLACLAVDPKGYGPILDSAPYDEAARVPLELARYGTTARAVGVELLRANGLPELFTETVGYPDDAPDLPLSANVLRFARRVVSTLCLTGGDKEAFLMELRLLIARSELPAHPERIEEAALQACMTAFEALRSA